MSAFLGPIHYWLFNKISIFENLEKSLLHDFSSIYGEEVRDIFKQQCEVYGIPLEEKPLEELIEHENIHGWLQSKIQSAEKRQAAFLTEVFKKFGNEAIEAAKNIFYEHGKKYGEIAKQKYETQDAKSLFKTLHDFILEGMPCDRVQNIEIAQEDLVSWNHSRCLHKDYWLEVKGEPTLLYELRHLWISGFIEEANPHFKYSAKFNNEINSFEYKISK